MMKFFRKYTKQLLALFMALLLVVWLGGEALTSWIQPDYDRSDEVVGTLLGEQVRQKDLVPALNQLDTLTLMPQLQWQAVWIYALPDLGVRPNDQMTSRRYHAAVLQARQYQELDQEEWFLLLTEARRNGTFVPTEEVEQFKMQIRLTGEALGNLRKNHRLSTDHINQAIHSFLMVRQQAVAACRNIGTSEADIQDFVRQAREKADVSALEIDSSKFIDHSYQPSQEEIAAFFEKHKSATSQPVGLSFGYQQPEAVQVEYIRVSSDNLKSQQTIAEEAAFSYWETHKQEFTQPTSQPAATPATRPAPPKPYATFAEARSAVISKMQKTRADNAALAIARDLIEQLGKPWQGIAETRPADTKEAPTSEKAPDLYPKLVRQMATKYPKEALSYTRLDMMAASALTTNQEIGQSAVANQGIGFSDIAFLVQGLEAKPTNDKRLAPYFRSVYETCAVPLVDEAGNAFVFRTVAIRPKQPPATVDAVRQQVITDIRKKRAYDAAGERARALKDKAGAVGIEAAFRADPDLVKRLGETALAHPAPFAREAVFSYRDMPPFVRPNYVEELGSDERLIDACFALAAETTTQPARLLVWEQPEYVPPRPRPPQSQPQAEPQPHPRWLVVQLHRLLPVTQAEYKELRQAATDHWRHERQTKLLASWFDPDQIAARLAWKPAHPRARDQDGQSGPTAY